MRGHRHQAARRIYACVCLCVFWWRSKATAKAGRTGPTQQAFSKGRKTSGVPGSLWELHAEAHSSALCWETRPQCLSQQQGEGLLGSAEEGRRQSTQITSSLRPLSGNPRLHTPSKFLRPTTNSSYLYEAIARAQESPSKA